jgi:hypothetical protein
MRKSYDDVSGLKGEWKQWLPSVAFSHVFLGKEGIQLLIEPEPERRSMRDLSP